ncbi:hypothetical protein Q3G72_033096 [Acer saccharum]|nr:hypothetical protein Q3G72_033096 [Acer saccharum]
MVNGMHIYGWPITAKVADYGWSKRRSIVDRGYKPANYFGNGVPNSIGANRNVRENKADGHEGSCDKVNRSFVEAVRKNLPETFEKRDIRDVNIPTMSWFGPQVDEEWLFRSAVGVLKEFCNIYQTNSSPGLSRLIWVDIFGVPVECWNKEFFKKLRGQVGETVWIDEDTISRSRSDKGLHPPEKMKLVPRTGVAEVPNGRGGDDRGGPVGNRVTKRMVELDIVREKEKDSRIARGKELEDKGKGRRIYNLKSKSLWFPMCKSGVRIGIDRRGRVDQLTEEESSSSGPDFMRSKGPNIFEGEPSKILDKGSLSPCNVIMVSDGPSLKGI